jgi:hypothetical protein
MNTPPRWRDKKPVWAPERIAIGALVFAFGLRISAGIAALLRPPSRRPKLRLRPSGVVPSGLSPPDYSRRRRDRISGPMLFPVAVNAIVSNDDFAWSAFANEIAFLNPDDLDGSTAVARIVVVQYLSDVQHFNPCAQ